MTLALVVIDHSSIRWIIADKNCIAIGPSAAAFDTLLDRTRGDKPDFLCQKIRRQRTQRSDIVHDPNAATVRRQDEIGFTRLNGKIANGDSGKMVALELRPVFSAINRNPKSELRAEKEQVRFDKVFLNDMRVSANAFDVPCSDERRPCFSVIGSFENIRRHVAESVPIESCVCSARVEAACLHPADPGILWQTRNITDQIVPRFPAITGKLKVDVIGANPDE